MHFLDQGQTRFCKLKLGCGVTPSVDHISCPDHKQLQRTCKYILIGVDNFGWGRGEGGKECLVIQYCSTVHTGCEEVKNGTLDLQRALFNAEITVLRETNLSQRTKGLYGCCVEVSLWSVCLAYTDMNLQIWEGGRACGIGMVPEPSMHAHAC